MIKTLYGQTTIMADSRSEIKADFCCIVKSLIQFFMEEEGMSKEQAKEEVMEMIETTFTFEEDDETDDKLKEKLEELLEILKGRKADE